MSESITELCVIDWARWPELLATFGDAVRDLDLPTLRRLTDLEGSGVEGMADDLVCIVEVKPGWLGRLFGAQSRQQLDPGDVELWRLAVAHASTSGSSVSWPSSCDGLAASLAQLRNLPEHLEEAREDILAALHARSPSEGLVWVNEV